MKLNEEQERIMMIIKFFLETSSPLQAATKLVPVPESLMSPDFRPPSGLARILPKTPPSKLSSPCQITLPSKLSLDNDGKAIPIINTINHMAKTSLGAIKANALVKSNSATNCSMAKPNIAKPIVTYGNSKCPHSVKINNYVQSKTLPVKRTMKSSNLVRIVQRPRNVGERIKSNLNKENKDVDADNGTQSSDEDSEVCQAKLDSIRHRANQRRQEDSNRGEIRSYHLYKIPRIASIDQLFYVSRSGSNGKGSYLHSKDVAGLSYEKPQ